MLLADLVLVNLEPDERANLRNDEGKAGDRQPRQASAVDVELPSGRALTASAIRSALSRSYATTLDEYLGEEDLLGLLVPPGYRLVNEEALPLPVREPGDLRASVEHARGDRCS